MSATDQQPRALGKIQLSTKNAKGCTVLDNLHQSGSSRCLFPRASAKAMEAVLLNTAGGVTGGDRFSVSVQAGSDTTLTVTTQACERAYKAQPSQVGKIRNRLKIAPHARINWLPQETILFNGCALDRKLKIDMHESSSLLMVEPLVFGRVLMGETLSDAWCQDRVEIRLNGTPIYLDALRLSGDIHAHLLRPFIANGAMAMASVVYVADDVAAHLNTIRALLPDTAGVSQIRDNVLTLRILAKDSFELRQCLVPILKRLNGGNFPRCWMI